METSPVRPSTHMLMVAPCMHYWNSQYLSISPTLCTQNTAHTHHMPLHVHHTHTHTYHTFYTHTHTAITIQFTSSVFAADYDPTIGTCETCVSMYNISDQHNTNYHSKTTGLSEKNYPHCTVQLTMYML